MNASATIRASYVRATRMSMMSSPPTIPVMNPIADLESRPANSEKLANFVAVNHLEHREKCDLERAKIYVYDEPSYLDWDNSESFSARVKKMYTIFPYRDPIWLVAIVFAVGSLDLVINAFLDLLPQLDPELQFETNETIAIPTTVLIGSIFFFAAGIFDTFGALNADRGTLETSKVDRKVTYRPALIGSPEFKWIPSWVKLWDLTMTNLAFQAGLIVLFGGVIFMFAGIVDFPELIPEEAPLFATIVFGPQVIHGALFLIANAILAISEQERWYKPKFWDADWQGAFLNTVGGFGFMTAGLFLFGEDKLSAAVAALVGSWAFFIGSMIRWCAESIQQSQEWYICRCNRDGGLKTGQNCCENSTIGHVGEIEGRQQLLPKIVMIQALLSLLVISTSLTCNGPADSHDANAK
ncbi:hypothetical protein BU25DRAFT_451263 [Macroventuria anomochaeta]|uniref:Uncharacterized protein n=1 Tax=Macroventuria anomochaeta TaxID=301207 RepID=A0ACB6RNW8_9PLEO|nr:uncharacterized protein BU25DRAFT_451263 [Macroventuria anomochaeta]KAF2623508.1 hypothetical protein BU25DRAFT_451263 [Macroventuria anomochaeta]